MPLIFHRISIKALLAWELLAFACHVVVLVLTLLFLQDYGVLQSLILLTLLVSGIYICMIYLPYYYGSIRYTVTDTAIVLQKGVFFSKKQMLYKDKLVFVSLIKSPLTALFGICSLLVEATGASIFISGLEVKTAKTLAADFLVLAKK